jgi:hypothetical protein
MMVQLELVDERNYFHFRLNVVLNSYSMVVHRKKMEQLELVDEHSYHFHCLNFNIHQFNVV